MKKLFLNSIMLILALAVIFTACKKKKDDVDTTDDTTEQSTAGSDESRFSEETDQVLVDAENLVGGSSIAGGRVAAYSVCGATVDSTGFATYKKITLNFDGTTSCVDNTRKRSGQIVIQLTSGANWNAVGAVLTITFNNYKVTRNSDSKSITINGTKTITNVNGGLVKNLTTSTSVTHVIMGTGLTVTFDDGTVRTWNTNRKRVFTKETDGNYTITVSGNNAVDGYFNVAVWGTNRYGLPFYTVIDTPVKLNSCNSVGIWTAISGVKTHKGLKREITVTFGVNQDGTNNGTCLAYGFKVDWTNAKNESKEAVVSY
jgi:hypothetical protein